MAPGQSHGASPAQNIVSRLMNIKIFRKENAIIRKISDSYSVFNFLTAADSEKVSVAVGDAANHNETTTINSDRAYYILAGEIIVNENLIGKPGDVIFIPSDTEYNFKGTFKAVIVNSPPFKKENEK